MSQLASDTTITLSIVIPVYNEADGLRALVGRLVPVVQAIGEPFEIIFVDDGSDDGSHLIVAELARSTRQIRLVRLSRNFGHQAALYAGMAAAKGEQVVTLDADLQHPPELISELVARRRGGAEIVQAVRRNPVDESIIKRAASRGFYWLLSRLAQIRVTPGASDFRLLSREPLNAFLACGERSRFNRGLVQWIGFDYCEVLYDAERRAAGKSKYSYRAMLRLAGDAIFSFSWWPLRFAGLMGAFVSISAAAYLLFVLWARFFGGPERTQPGWSSTLATVLILGGAQLMVLWIIGEYLGRLYEEAKQRPLYIVRGETLSAGQGSVDIDENEEASPLPSSESSQVPAREQ